MRRDHPEDRRADGIGRASPRRRSRKRERERERGKVGMIIGGVVRYHRERQLKIKRGVMAQD